MATYLGKCSKCKVAARFEAEPQRVSRRRDSFGGERVTVLTVAAPWGEATYHAERREVQVRCLCGGFAAFAKLVGRVSKTKCGARCINSTGFSCECQCGGANHGRGHTASP